MKHGLPSSQFLIRCHTVNTQTQLIKSEKHLADGFHCFILFQCLCPMLSIKLQSMGDSKESCTENERNSCFSGGKEMKNIRFAEPLLAQSLMRKMHIQSTGQHTKLMHREYIKSRGQDYKEKHKTQLKTNVKRTVLNNTKLRHF